MPRFCTLSRLKTSGFHEALAALLVLSLSIASGSVHAETWWASVRDNELKGCLQKLAEKHAWQKTDDVKEISCHSGAIQSLEGLPPLPQLEVLSLHNNKLTDVVVRDLPQLKRLVVSRNRLTSLTVQNTPALTELFFFDNRLEQLELKDLPALKLLKGNSNKLEVFRYSQLPALEKIYLFNNKMPDIDIDHLPALRYMDVRQNPMPDELYERMDIMNNTTFLHDGNAPDWQQ